MLPNLSLPSAANIMSRLTHLPRNLSAHPAARAARTLCVAIGAGAAVLLTPLPSPAQAPSKLPAIQSSMDNLSNFLRFAQTGTSPFTQVVTTKKNPKGKTSSGTFSFSRPDRFRFEYEKPFAQSIIADGTTLWIYDRDLKQIIQRPQNQALGNTPAAIVATVENLADLEQDYTVADQGQSGGTNWVMVTPKDKESSILNVRIGFKNKLLSSLEIADRFGQKSTLTFTDMVTNGPPQNFVFTPPAGVAIITQ